MKAETRREGEIFVRKQRKLMANAIAAIKQCNVLPVDRAHFLAAVRKAGMAIPKMAEAVVRSIIVSLAEAQKHRRYDLLQAFVGEGV